MAVIEAVDPMLLVAFAKTGKEHLAHVRLAIAVGVLGVKNVRRGGHDHALAPGHHAGGEVQPVQEHGGLVVDAVVVGVLEKADDAAWFAFAVHAQRIIAHLHHPQFSVRAPLEGDRVLDQRFAGDQLHFESGPDADGLERIFRRERRRLKAGEQALEGAALHLVRQGGSVFVLDPEMAGLKPGAVVAAVAGDEGNFCGIAAPARQHFPCPAGAKAQIQLGDEQVQREGLFVGENDVR